MSLESIVELENVIHASRAEGRITPAETIDARATLEVAKALLSISKQIEVFSDRLRKD